MNYDELCDYEYEPECEVQEAINATKIYKLTRADVYNNIQKKLCLDSNYHVPTYHEIIRAKCKAFIDYDQISTPDKFEEDRNKALTDIRKKLVSQDYYLFDSSGVDKQNRHKVSFRIIFRKIHFDACKDITKFVESFGFQHDFIDWGVYKKAGSKQMVRLPYTSKKGEVRYLKKLNEQNQFVEFQDITSQEYETYFITNIEGCKNWSYCESDTLFTDTEDEKEQDKAISKKLARSRLRNIPKPKTRDENLPAAISVQEMPSDPATRNCSVQEMSPLGPKVDRECEIGIDQNILDDILTALNIDRAEDYNLWKYVCFAVKGTDMEYGWDSIDILDQFSMQASSYRNRDDVQDKYNQGNGDLKIGSLWKLLKDDNPQEFKRLQQQIKKKNITPYVARNRFDYDDPYTFQDFYNEYNKKRFESLSILDSTLNQICPRVIARVVEGEGCYIKKSLSICDMTKKLGISDFKMSYMEESESKNGKKEKKIKLSEYLSTKFGYANITTDLNNESCKNISFNLWNGFKAKEVELDGSTPKSKGLQMMLDFIYKAWGNSCQEQYEYIMLWFQGIVKNLNGINRVALAMISAEGTGKNTLLDFMNYIVPSNNIANLTGITAVTQKHNDIILNKRIVIINEMSSTRDEFRSNFDKIKSLITDEIISVEPKGRPIITAKNIGNYVLFTNNRDSIIVSTTDRRYAVFEMGNDFRNNEEYFSKLRATCFNQDIANEFYTYLLQYTLEESSTVSLNKIPETAIRRELQLLSKSSPLKFLDHVKEFPGLYRDEESKEAETRVKATILYSNYKTWCSDNNESCVSNTKFGTIVATIIEKVKCRDANYYAIKWDN